MSSPDEPAPTPTLRERLVDDLATLAAWWPGLHADLVPGTRRRAVTGQRESRPQLACPDCGWPIAWVVATRQPYCTRPHNRATPACTTARALGYSPASLRVDVLDDLVTIRDRVHELVDAIATLLGDGERRPAPSADPLGAPVAVADVATVNVARGHDTVWQPSNPLVWRNAEDPERPIDMLASTERIVEVGAHRAVGGYTIDTSVLTGLAYLRIAVERLDGEAVRELAGRLGRLIGLARHAASAGRRSARVPKPCPVCDRLSLVVVEALYDPDTGWLLDEPRARRTALCTSEVCECADPECSCHAGRRHRWDEGSWKRLGLVITDGDELVNTSEAAIGGAAS